MSGSRRTAAFIDLRRLKDRSATVVITGGGAVVVGTILLLFVFLVYEVLPLLSPASIGDRQSLDWRTPDASPLLWLSVEEYGEIVFSLAADGTAEFTRLADGAVLQSRSLDAAGEPPVTVAAAGTGLSAVALGYASGSVRVIRPVYSAAYVDDQREIVAELKFPLGPEPLDQLRGQAVTRLALGELEDSWLIAVEYDSGALEIWRPLANGPDSYAIAVEELGSFPPSEALYFGDSNRWLLQLDREGEYRLWSLDAGTVYRFGEGRLFPTGVALTASALLQGGQSLVTASSDRQLAQYFFRDTETGPEMTWVRHFSSAGEPIAHLLPEHRRRGFLALNSDLQWFHATAGERVLVANLPAMQAQAWALSPRGNTLLQSDAAGQLHRWPLLNPHPEISLQSLWRQVWYESYPEPAFVYQSSASSNDFEPKYSMTPLVFGTLKAAFYAMLFAAPVAIAAAIYTAFFMAPALRRRVKPLIELLEALPTVILGFLAGLWLAPWVEGHLSSVISLLLTVPPGVLLFAFCWSCLPMRLRSAVPDGWQALILLPVIVGLGWLGLALGKPLETLLFAGDARQWITLELGLAFDQRNALIVGIAMGLAVIPTIFSIAEDAIYSVPQHLGYGSLALGATPWQTLTGVVLPTASPGVFSAVMIGFGRAVGETMIVLMATGNTPIMEANLFEGMRTLAANIAVEVPEAEVASTHFRVLFLAAFLLFVFTFFVNTLAEVVRQRLRTRYGALG